MAQLTVPRARRMVVATKAESTYGTDALGGVYVAADIVPAFDINVDDRVDEIANLSIAGDIGRLPSIMGIETGQVSFSTYLRGNAAVWSASVKPEIDRPLRACTLIGTGSFTPGAETWTYARSATHESYTIYVVQEYGRTIKLVGCHGTADFSFRAGAATMARFTLQGKVSAVSDGVSFVSGTVPSTPAFPVFKTAQFQFGSGNYAPRIASIGFSLGNTLSPVPSINDATGLAGFFVSDTNPRITIDPEADTVANMDWHAALVNGTVHDMTWQVGLQLKNRIDFTFGTGGGSRVQVVANSYGTRDGLTSYPTTLLATSSAGLDDFEIIFR